MGNCASTVNCTVTGQPIQSDPDIAGIGVLVAFGATAVITFITIVVGYLTDSLPDSTLTELDRACIAKLRWRAWKNDGPLNTFLRRSTATISAIALPGPPIPDQNLDPNEKRNMDRIRRTKGLERFLLALSDQQLVTGLAVLIAGYTNRCSRSLYHFNIIAALGWFSSTTHLSTLAVLRAYLIDHPRVRNWRVIAMLGVFGLLVVSQFESFSTQHTSLPVQCAFESFGPGGLYSLDIIQLILVMIFLCVSYANRTRRLYNFDPDWSIQGWIARVLAKPLIREKNVRNLERIVVTTSTLSKANQGATYRKLKQRRRWWRYCGQWVEKRSALSRRVAEVVYLTQEMQRSFMREILTLLFGVSYGVSQVITNRNQIPDAGLSGDQNAMGFGQLVPLLLIALPVLAAVEVYFERHDEIGISPSPLRTFVAQLDPATLLMQDDTDAAVATTLQMMTKSTAGSYRNSAGPSRQSTDNQSAPLLPDASSDIPMSEMRSSTARESKPNTPIIAADGRDEEFTTAAAAAAASDDVPAMIRGDVESGGHQITRTNLTYLRTPWKKARMLSIMFLLQGAFLVFFGVVLAGAGPAYLYVMAAIISLMDSLFVVVSIIMDFRIQVKEGRGSKET